jgi:hypothetical protein
VKSRLFLSSLVLVGLALVAPLLSDAATQLDPARIVVRADRALAPVSPLLFGQNHGPWMNTTAGYVADYREAGVTLLRFPGGNWGDENDLFPNNVDDSEYNVSWASSVRRHLGTQVGALWNAEVMGRLADLGVEMAAHFALQGTSWQGLIGMLQDPRPAYGVYKLYAHWGTTQVDAESSDEALLPAFASLHDDGQLAILVVNKDPLEAREATLTVEGFRPAGQARVWLQDEEHLAEELPAIVVAEMFPHTFPPYSVTLFILDPVPRGRWLLWAGLGLLALALVTLGVLMPRLRRSR